MKKPLDADRSGFSLVEVIIAMLILSLGILAMGSATGYVITQVRVADVRTERSAAVQQAVERLHAEPFDSIDDRTEANADTLGNYRVWWDVEDQGDNLVDISVYSSGPGYRLEGGWTGERVDTFRLSLARGQTGS